MNSHSGGGGGGDNGRRINSGEGLSGGHVESGAVGSEMARSQRREDMGEGVGPGHADKSEGRAKLGG